MRRTTKATKAKTTNAAKAANAETVKNAKNHEDHKRREGSERKDSQECEEPEGVTRPPAQTTGYNLSHQARPYNPINPSPTGIRPLIPTITLVISFILYDCRDSLNKRRLLHSRGLSSLTMPSRKKENPVTPAYRRSKIEDRRMKIAKAMKAATENRRPKPEE
jgi:hypothetical protein